MMCFSTDPFQSRPLVYYRCNVASDHVPVTLASHSGHADTRRALVHIVTRCMLNEKQHLVLVGISIESSLEWIIEWLTGNYNVNIKAVALTYVKISSGDELLVKT